MSNYSAKERAIAVLLSSSPRLKARIKKSYQIFNYLFNKKNYKFKSVYPILNVDNTNKSSFFGYYDKCPENVTGEYVIYHRTSFETSLEPSHKNALEIVLKNNLTGKIETIDVSYAYNWQQGAKLMWLTESKFIYNVFNDKNKSYESVIYDIHTNAKVFMSATIYDCYMDEFALSLNYNRLMNLRPDYGYRNLNDKIDYSNLENDGIFKIDLNSGVKSLLISLKKLVDMNPKASMKGAKHKVNHIMISPNGEKFMFMHRWLTPSGQRFDRLLVADSDGRNLIIVADGDMVSHCCWQDNDNIVGFMRDKTFGDTYYRINVNENTIKLLSKELLGFNDGHPSFRGNKMLFDSYPNRSRLKKLYVFDIETQKINELAEFFESFRFYNQTRCDLHPRWNKNGSKIFVDSVHEGKRNLYQLNIN